MTWTSLPVVSRIVECEPPYSFYFGLIEPHWQSIASDSRPLHRLCTLARKQGVRALVIDDATELPHVVDEITTLDAKLGGGGCAEALLLTFLSEVPADDGLQSLGNRSLIGQCTLINYRSPGTDEFATTFIYEAFFATPSLGTGEPLLNNYINCEAEFAVVVRERSFDLKGLYYAQQNGITSVCAHASIRMTARTLFPDGGSLRTREINELVGDPPPADGMLVEQISNALEHFAGREVDSIDCSNLSPTEYVSILTAAADSGDIALLIFETGLPVSSDDEIGGVTASPSQRTNHVVVVYGYTRNTDEWHPQAIPEYAGEPSSRHSPSSAWVDHFVIHDDNFGPYLALSSRALETDRSVRAEHILIVRRLRANLHPHVAEAAGAIILGRAIQVFGDDAPDNNWLNYLLRYRKPLVTRPVLISREEYCQHIANTVAHDGSRLGRGKIKPIRDSLPEVLWMVEFTLPDLFTGNHSKLGEVLLDAHHPAGKTFSAERVRGIRVPSRLMLAQGGAGEPLAGLVEAGHRIPQNVLKFPLTSHSPLYERNPGSRQW